MGKGHVPMPSRVKEARLSQPRPVSGAARRESFREQGKLESASLVF